MKNLALFAVAFITITSCEMKDEEMAPDTVSSTVTEEVIKDSSVVIEKIESDNMKLGAFSVSLSVKDLAVSKEFYENLGFSEIGGDMSMNYLIMRNENAIVGLFQGMFDGNILTFNPGWNENGENIETFDDIRKIQDELIEKAIQLDTKIDSTNTEGPASIMLKDPDGNLILIDQHR